MSTNRSGQAKMTEIVDPRNISRLHFKATSMPKSTPPEKVVWDFEVHFCTQRTKNDQPKSCRIWHTGVEALPASKFNLLHRYWAFQPSKAYGKSLMWWVHQKAGLIMNPKTIVLTSDQLNKGYTPKFRKMQQACADRTEELDGQYRKVHTWKQPHFGWKVTLKTEWCASVLQAESQKWQQFSKWFPSNPIYLNQGADIVNSEEFNLGSIDDIEI